MLSYEDDYTIYSHGEISMNYVRILVIMPIDHYAKSLSDGFARFIDSTAGSPSCRFSAVNPLYSGTPKRVLLQTVKTQMKCSKLLHFIRVNTVCKGK